MKNLAFIFDMDGTLVDNMRFHTEVWLDVLASQGVVIDSDTFKRQTAGKTNTQILREQLGKDLRDDEINSVSEQKESLYRQRYRSHLKPVQGLRDFVDGARRLKIPLALATSAGSANVAFTLSALEMGACFQAVIDCTGVQHGKPHPEIFLMAASQLQVPPEACVVFEDSMAGIEAARRAGMQTVVITTTLHAEELAGRSSVLLAVPDYTTLDPAVLINGSG